MFQTFLRAESGRWRFSFAWTRGKGFLSIKANGENPQESGNRPWLIGHFPFSPPTNSILPFISLDETREFALRTATIFVLKRDTRTEMPFQTVSFYFRVENLVNFEIYLFLLSKQLVARFRLLSITFVNALIL